jgi:hypothetical protein
MSVIAEAILGAEYMGLRGLTKHKMLGGRLSRNLLGRAPEQAFTNRAKKTTISDL